MALTLKLPFTDPHFVTHRYAHVVRHSSSSFLVRNDFELNSDLHKTVIQIFRPTTSCFKSATQSTTTSPKGGEGRGVLVSVSD